MPRVVGPVIVDVIGAELSAEEREILQHPLVGGVILFTRNYENVQQMTQLCQSIRAVRSEPLLIAVDQEGGRVQRFREGFTRLPAMGEFGELYETNSNQALQQAEELGCLMATELLTVGIDISFAPVLDLNKELNQVVGDRAFHREHSIVTKLAKEVMRGMHKAGMAATGKHFPGHGSVSVDSHLAMPIDERSFEKIAAEDLQPFKALIQANIDALMPAHILFPAVDDKPVGFSRQWLDGILRKKLKFSGVIFSDDLNMEGAGFAGDYIERARTALEAGCDLVLICNNRQGAISILDGLSHRYVNTTTLEKIKKLQGKFSQ
jgi:beta-N-acetylhexosaminidase